jgi:hypothetical protein
MISKITATKTCTLFLTTLFLMSPFTLQIVTAQPSNSNNSVAPATLWQQKYPDYYVLADTGTSNLIQTTDGGFAFLSVGYGFQGHLIPARLFKTDSTGNIQWTKTLDSFTASTIIQTSDGGYEISGNWRPQVYSLEPTLLKTDAYGNIQWSQNYSSVPNLGVNSAMIQTSDGGFAYVRRAYIVKTDSGNQTLWGKYLVYNRTRSVLEIELNWTVPDIPIDLCSLIETSDGSLAAVGVALTTSDNPYMGTACLIKTEAFLPLPSSIPLPTPISTPTPTPSATTTSAPIVEALLIASLIIVVVMVAGLLLYFKKRKR